VEATITQEFSALEKEVCNAMQLKDIHVSKQKLKQKNTSVTKNPKKLVFNGIKKTIFVERDFYSSKHSS